MTSVETARDVLVALTRRYAFGEVAALVADGAAGARLTRPELARIGQLCDYGQRLLDLDAEDLADPDAPADLVDRGRACRMPQDPRERYRGALASLRPAYRLLLEVIAVRWRRRETAALVAAAHIASEYAPLLAWEGVLGHAGDPARLARDPAFAGPDSRFGGDYSDRRCPHSRPEKSAAGRALRAADDSPVAWRSYLDRQHSTVSHALGVCAAECRGPCTVVSARHPKEQAGLAEACRAAFAYADCALVRLRHSAPVGHGFGVPSPDEVFDAWRLSRESVARHGAAGRAVLTEDGYPLPGLPALFGAIAGAEIAPDTLLFDTAAGVITVLEAA